ncbi:hypothetical protein SAMN04488121_104128 [Chitinophaga filiformis]|uniref:Uncharacterized protein n=1 Tax=Chitinophaga filiformis TaxID=104663 RepID=A0A1G7TXJ4_CHIFI|nr:hypothetical protein SAMN04488121_104128 [Chitinophaga filiformis]
MRPTSVFLSVICLFAIFCGCRKDDRHPVLQKGLRGKVIYSSCATTAVQVLNKNIGSDWTNCHDQKKYQHMIDVIITNLDIWSIQGEFTFDIVENEPYGRCAMYDCGPSQSFTIAIIKD